MLITDHLTAQAETLELQGFRLQNTTALTTPVTGAVGLVKYLTSGSVGPYVYDGTAWKHFGAPRTTGSAGSRTFPDIPLTDTYLLRGASGIATEVATSSIGLDKWGTPTTPVPLGGQRITGLSEPSANDDAATKFYVDNAVQGLAVKDACKLATNLALPHTPAYSGTGKTLTSTGNNTLTAALIDSGSAGYTLAVNDRVLVKSQVTAIQNGIYHVTSLGGATPWVLTRTTDADTNPELLGASVFIERGTYSDTSWNQTSDTFEIGTASPSGSITFVQMFGAGSYIAGNGLKLVGNTFHFAQDASYTVGSLFYASGTSGNDAVTQIVPTAYVTGVSSGRILQQDGTTPKWSKIAFPHTVTTNSIQYASATDTLSSLAAVNATVLGTNLTGVPTYVPVASDSILSKTGTGVPTWATTLPFIVGVDKGGTGVNNSTLGGEGSLVYRTGGALLSPSVDTPIDGEMAIWSTSPTPAWTYFDIFSTPNTWDAIQTHQSHILLQTPAPAIGTFSNGSPFIQMGAAGNAGGTVTWNQWALTASTTDTAGNGYFGLWSAMNTTFPASVQLRVRFAHTGNVYMGGPILGFSDGGSFNGTLTHATLTLTSKTWTLPDGTGTLPLPNLAQTWTAKQVFQHATATTVLLATNDATVERFALQIDGKMLWGVTGALADTNLYRGGADLLKTDDAFQCGGTMTIGGDTAITGNLSVSGNISGGGTWQGSVVGLAYGGTGRNMSADTAGTSKLYGIIYKGSGTQMSTIDPIATANRALFNTSTAAAPAWSAYSFPGSIASAGQVVYSSGATALALTPSATAQALLKNDGAGVVTWTAFLNPVRTTGASTAGGVARRHSERKAGGGATTMTITHNLSTYDVGVWVRKSDAANDVNCNRATTTGAPYEQVVARIDVVSKDAVQITFGVAQTSSDWWVVTVVG